MPRSVCPCPPPTPTPPGTSEIFSAHPAIFCHLLSTPSALRPFLNPPPPPQSKSAFISPNHQSSRVHILICCCKYFHWGTSAPEQVDAVKNIQKSFCSPGYVHLYVKCCQPITEVWTVFPPEGMRIGIQRCPESPCTCSYIRSSLDEYLSTDSSVLVPVIPCALVAAMC